ncbi:ATP-binding protein [Tissierella sp. Yu-01]|uniref:nucleotide-binding protein n=1 Tax=Tissierella sp. Yu-01 TaxID=3035694 RepID=UPI00240E11A0|nr:ATP-binding protein [Tissierella sp. Yu-01]WFA10307.1 ATP-binding protein [Tissierella sp. Yu-01]
MLKDNRIRIIIGHYGSGKTEFSVNYAVKLASYGKKVALVDLDVVNLYFRSREKADILEQSGVKVIGSAIKASAIDIPSISGEVLTPLQDESYEAVLDVGGDPVGARALGRYSNYFTGSNYDMFFVLNANRSETQTAEKAIEYITRIQDVARAKVTGIINNTHLLKSTTIDDVLRGYDLAKRVSMETNIPIKYNSVLESIASDLPKELVGEIFPIKLYMREEWML